MQMEKMNMTYIQYSLANLVFTDPEGSLYESTVGYFTGYTLQNNFYSWRFCFVCPLARRETTILIRFLA